MTDERLSLFIALAIIGAAIALGVFTLVTGVDLTPGCRDVAGYNGCS